MCNGEGRNHSTPFDRSSTQLSAQCVYHAQSMMRPSICVPKSIDMTSPSFSTVSSPQLGVKCAAMWFTLQPWDKEDHKEDHKGEGHKGGHCQVCLWKAVSLKIRKKYKQGNKKGSVTVGNPMPAASPDSCTSSRFLASIFSHMSMSLMPGWIHDCAQRRT